MRKLFILIFSFGILGELFAFNQPVTPVNQLPAYYESIDGESGKDLLDAIQQVAKRGYRTDDFRYDSIWYAFKHTDIRPDGYIWEIYSTCVFEYEKDRTSNTSQTGECKGYNREHAICQSWFGEYDLQGKKMSSSKKNSPGSDIFHIYPASYGMNSRHSNRPYGEVLNAANTSENGTKYGTPVTTMSVTNSVAGAYVEGKMTLSTNVLEPADEYKGDIARSYFGTMVKWAGEWVFNLNENGRVIFDATIDVDTHYAADNYYGLTPFGLAMLLKWHRQDPVSQKEIDRNNGIQFTQGNRNPFIDYPYLVEYIWGEKSGEELDLELLLCAYDERFELGVSDGYIGEKQQVVVDTVFWMVGNTPYDTSYVAHNARIKYLPATPVSCSNQSTQFMGWTTTPMRGVSHEAPAVLYNQVSDFPSVSENKYYYAVFAQMIQSEVKGETITLNKSDSTDWTLSGLKQTSNKTDGAYWLLIKDAKIISPSVDLKGLDSVAITMRSYYQKTTVDISIDGVNYGKLSAQNTTMQRYVWLAPEMTGSKSLQFTGADATASYGPGLKEITIYIGGEHGTYTNYLTHCSDSPTGLSSTIHGSPATKMIRNGQLLILHNGCTYNAQGIQL